MIAIMQSQPNSQMDPGVIPCHSNEIIQRIFKYN